MNIVMLVTISQSSQIISRCSRQSQWSIWRTEKETGNMEDMGS